MSYRNRVEVCENEKHCGNMGGQACVYTAFLIQPKFHSCLHNSIEIWYMFSLSSWKSQESQVSDPEAGEIMFVQLNTYQMENMI